MSILKPKDGDYITRGILLLLGWFLFGWMPFSFLGAIMFSFLFGPTTAVGGATIFFVLAVPLGLFGYSKFLDWSFKTVA